METPDKRSSMDEESMEGELTGVTSDSDDETGMIIQVNFKHIRMDPRRPTHA